MILSEDPNINQTQHIFVFIYCKKVEGGGGWDRKEACTNTYNERQNIAVKFCTYTKNKKAT